MPRWRGGRALFEHCVNGVALQPGHEVDAPGGQRGKPSEGDRRLVKDQDGPGREPLLLRDRRFVAVARGQHHEGGQTAVVIEGEMQLHRAFGPLKDRPGKGLDTQLDHGRIETQQLVLEAKAVRAGRRATLPEQLIEDRLKQGPRTMLVGVRQGRALGRTRHPEMLQFAFATRQPATDLAQRMGPPEVAKQHCHELRPTVEATSMSLRSGLSHRPLKIRAWKKLE
jgi:hypothetical protein